MFIYLVRHGQSVWNAEHRHQGWQDVPLSPLGELQAAAIGQRLKDVQFDYYFTSPIYRCYQTAEAIVRAQGLDPAATLQKMDEIKEGRLSASMEGMLTKDMVKTWSEEQKQAFKADYTFKFDDGESVQEIMQRTLAGYAKIADLSEEAPPAEEENAADDVQMTRDVKVERPKIKPKIALVVAHRINVQFFVLHALDATDSVARYQTNIDRLDIGNCTLNIIEVNLKGKEPFSRTVVVNDSNHLIGVKVPE